VDQFNAFFPVHGASEAVEHAPNCASASATGAARSSEEARSQSHVFPPSVWLARMAKSKMRRVSAVSRRTQQMCRHARVFVFCLPGSVPAPSLHSQACRRQKLRTGSRAGNSSEPRFNPVAFSRRRPAPGNSPRKIGLSRSSRSARIWTCTQFTTSLNCGYVEGVSARPLDALRSHRYMLTTRHGSCTADACLSYGDYVGDAGWKNSRKRGKQMAGVHGSRTHLGALRTPPQRF
jgi:hypothetical protein